MTLRWIHTFFLLALAVVAMAQTELCDNGIDDDGDGLIDLNDPECPCSTALIGAGTASYIRNHSFEDKLCCPFGFVSPPFTPPWLDCATGWHQATSATSDYFHECGYSPAGFNLPPPDGEGAVGFYASPADEYFEYVGTCLTYPLPANPLLAGTTYTLSLWIYTSITNDTHSQPLSQGSYVTPFTDQLPLALFGYANACVPFPIATSDCIGYMPGWSELGRVDVQPAWDWTRVSITFTPTADIHSIMIGGACDTPNSLSGAWVTDPEGETYFGMPYFTVDDLMLTIAGDQVLQPVSSAGTLCAETAAAVGAPPSGATNLQWYMDGVALPGQTGANLDISGQGLAGGVYTLASSFNGECLMGSTYVPPAIAPVPRPAIDPREGCAPLVVLFADTTGMGTQTMLWDLGDGTTLADSSFSHTYMVPGTYSVTLTVRNDAGCTGDTLIPDAVIVHPGANASIAATPNPVFAEDPTVQLNGSGANNILSWWWDLGSAAPPTSDSQSLSATFPPVPGDYPVMLVVITAGGCVDTVRSVVTVIDPGVIEMPNVFSPNGDGSNDRFIPIGYKGAPGLLEIFNRWGQLMFSTTALAQGWNGSGAPDGTYFYIVAPDEPGTEKLTGHVTLLR